MLMLKNSIVRFAVLAIFSSSFLACGLVDAEAAQGVLDIRTEILAIHTNEVDPLVSQIDTVESKIEPLEQEIEMLEQQIEDLYDKGQIIGDKFETQMNQNFETLFLEDNDALDEFRDTIKIEERELEDFQDKRMDELSETEDESSDYLRDQSDLWWESFEDEQRAKSKEIQRQMNEYHDTNPYETKKRTLEDAWRQLDEVRYAIDEKEIAIETEIFLIEDKKFVLEDSRDAVNDSSENTELTEEFRKTSYYRELFDEKRIELDLLYTQIGEIWNDQTSTDSAALTTVEWKIYDTEMKKVWDAFHIETEDIEKQRSEIYNTADESLENNSDLYLLDEQIKASIQKMDEFHVAIHSEDKLIAALSNLSANSEVGVSPEKSSLIANLESKKDLIAHNILKFANIPQTIESDLQENPEYTAFIVELAELTALLEDLPAQIEDPDVDADGVSNGLIDNPEYTDINNAMQKVEIDIQVTTRFLEGTGVISTNPEYADLGAKITNLKLEIDAIELNLNALENTNDVSSPELTAAYARRMANINIVEDMGKALEALQKIRAEQLNKVTSFDTANPGTWVVNSDTTDLSDSEAKFENMHMEAAKKRDAAIGAIEDKYQTGSLASDNSVEPVEAAIMQTQIDQLELELNQISADKKNADSLYESIKLDSKSQLRAINAEIQLINDVLDGDSRNKLNTIQKERKALEMEYLILEKQHGDLDQDRDLANETREILEEQLWDDFETWISTRSQEVEDMIENAWDDHENKHNEARDTLYDIFDIEWEDMSDKRQNLEESFQDSQEEKIRQLEDEKEDKFLTDIAPLEELAEELTSQISSKWDVLNVLYETRNELTDQLMVIEERVQLLDRQAEYGLLNIINGAIENVDQLESAGGLRDITNFSSLLDVATTATDR
jgi:hypothetical protein